MRTFQVRPGDLSESKKLRTTANPIIAFKTILIMKESLKPGFKNWTRGAKIGSRFIKFAEESPEPPIEDLHKYLCGGDNH
jgi:hypothetical protein